MPTKMADEETQKRIVAFLFLLQEGYFDVEQDEGPRGLLPGRWCGTMAGSFCKYLMSPWNCKSKLLLPTLYRIFALHGQRLF